MPQMTMLQAINDAMHVAMERDPDVVMLGEDIGKKGGVFGATDGLYDKFGALRVMDTPLSECGIIGTAVGMALYGLKPVPEIQFLDFIYPAFDQIVSEMAKMRYRSGGQFTCPMVVRSPSGGGIRGGHYHSQSSEAYFAHTPGLRVVMPSTPADAKGMLLASIFNEDPVIFLEPKRVYNGPFDGHHDRPIVPWSAHPLGEVPEGYYTVELGKARVHRPGGDLTVLTYGTLVHVAQAAAEETGIDAEIIDLRTLLPLDVDCIVQSVRTTGRCLVVHEATLTSGFGAELSATVQERAFHHLEAPVTRVCGYDTPYPHAHEWAYFPGPQRVGRAMQELMRA